MAPEDLQATFCATLVDEWVRCGVEHAVVSPGSRSTPLVLALAEDGRVEVHVHHDERSAGFLALGLAIGSWEPTVVVTTSGTAAVELHPAVVEADLARVPLLVCTADRPPELVDVGAPQAIDQSHLYGRAVRWFHAPGVADAAATARWRPMAARAYAEATGTAAGPVHLNLAFREPLVGAAGDLPPGREPGGVGWAWRPPVQDPTDAVVSLRDDLAGHRGVILAGAGSGRGEAVDEVARALGWPVLAAPQAPVWAVAGAAVAGADAILRTPLADGLRPELVVRLGSPLASRVVGAWIAGSHATEIVIAGDGRWVDAHGTAAVVMAAEPAEQLVAWLRDLGDVAPVDDGAWRAAWHDAGRLAATAIEEALAGEVGLTEPQVARSLVRSLPSGSQLVLSSSMPIRDVEWYVEPGRPVTAHANRGANGIDGIVSTAVGLAVATGAPTALLIGDVAFLHDVNGLLGAGSRDLSLAVVVVDNDGGGIFSFLPQAESDAIPSDRFEALFGTTHGLDLVAVAAAHGASARALSSAGDLPAALEQAFTERGVHVLVARTDRRANVELHRRLNAAVAAVASS